MVLLVILQRLLKQLECFLDLLLLFEVVMNLRLILYELILHFLGYPSQPLIYLVFEWSWTAQRTLWLPFFHLVLRGPRILS